MPQLLFLGLAQGGDRNAAAHYRILQIVDKGFLLLFIAIAAATQLHDEKECHNGHQQTLYPCFYCECHVSDSCKQRKNGAKSVNLVYPVKCGITAIK